MAWVLSRYSCGAYFRAVAATCGLAAFALLAGCASTPQPGAHYGRAPSVGAPPASVDSGLTYGGEGAPRVLPGGRALQCVPFAREQSGIEIYGDANTWWRQASGRYVRSGLPAVGSVLVLRGYHDPSRGHVAVVASVVSNREIKVNHANWLNGGEVSVSVPVMDVSPNNDWSEVRVWHVPGRHWGGRVYQAEGFIHPFALFASGS